MIDKYEVLPLSRIADQLPTTAVWVGLAYQGPGGCYAVREVPGRIPRYQVARVERRSVRIAADEAVAASWTEAVSEPFVTPEGAQRFARHLAGGGMVENRYGFGSKAWS